jgi:hypothetical protein
MLQRPRKRLSKRAKNRDTREIGPTWMVAINTDVALSVFIRGFGNALRLRRAARSAINEPVLGGAQHLAGR